MREAGAADPFRAIAYASEGCVVPSRYTHPGLSFRPSEPGSLGREDNPYALKQQVI
jgi:hypothetical protein